MNPNPPIDHTGERFGRLLVIERAGRDKYNHPTWRCLCVCGREAVVIGAHLRQGLTRSCGCLRVEVATATLRRRAQRAMNT